jgi:hypothetical protein
MVEKFAAGVVDTIGAPCLANLRQFSKKFETVYVKVILWGLGETNS